jgi:hypothetical protein
VAGHCRTDRNARLSTRGPTNWLACHAFAMQWHWGNIGSMLAGLSTIVIAVGALIRGPAVIRAWLDRQATAPAPPLPSARQET